MRLSGLSRRSVSSFDLGRLVRRALVALAVPLVSLIAVAPLTAHAQPLAAEPGQMPPGAKKPADKSARIQLHLGEQTAKRLNVHAALVGRNSSRVADEILSGWLGRFGKGREIFTDPVDGEVSGDVE